MHSISKSCWSDRFMLALLACLALAGCATTERNATSIVDYLYPNMQVAPATSDVPVLKLPLRVGFAFVPGNSSSAQQQRMFGGPRSEISRGSTLTEKQKMELLQEVASHFKKYPFVRDVQVIPSVYLTPGGGFANLDQIRTMYGLDTIVLLSYDQTQFTDEGALSLTYLTVVGAFVVPGEKNDTHTILDAVVYDIPSRKMLFRAPGMSQIKGSATWRNQSEELRADRSTGFTKAAEQMIKNLESELAGFRNKLKERPDEHRVIRPEGYKEK